MDSTKSEVKLSAVGDITLGDHPMCMGFGAASRFRKEDPVFPFEYVKNILSEADIAFGNLECTHSKKGMIKKNYHSLQMRGKQSDIDGLVKTGFNIVNVANNHSAQHGEECFLHTCELVQEKGLLLCGYSPSDHLVGVPAITEINELKIGFLGYSLRPRQYFEHNPPYTEGCRDGIIKDVKSLKNKVSVVIVSLHWGEEFIQYPSPKERALAREIIEAGAHLIIGHHPHVLRGIERYQQGVILYSLGNFVCDMAWDFTLRASAIFQCTLNETGVKDFDVVPVYIDEDYRPHPVSGKQGEEIRNLVDSLSKELSGYSPETDNLEKADHEYKKTADEENKSMRKKTHLFFLKNIYRYSPNVFLQQIGTYITNRVNEYKASS